MVEVAGNFSDAYHLAERIRLADPSWANLTSTFVNPYMTAAHATIFYEIHRQLHEPVGTIIMPIGAGPMLAGILQGAERLRDMGEIARLPVLIGVQSAGCAPIARAFFEGSDDVRAWEENAFGLAGSINDPLRGYAQDGTRTLRAIRRTDGFAVAVSDVDIETAMRDLGRQEGIAAEPAAAAPLAGLRALLKNNALPRPIVLVVSGHALKDPGALPGHGEPSFQAGSDVDPLAIIRAGELRFAQY